MICSFVEDSAEPFVFLTQRCICGDALGGEKKVTRTQSSFFLSLFWWGWCCYTGFIPGKAWASTLWVGIALFLILYKLRLTFGPWHAAWFVFIRLVNTYLCSSSSPWEWVFPEFHSKFAVGKSSPWIRQEVVLYLKSNLLEVLMVENVSILTLVLLFLLFSVI